MNTQRESGRRIIAMNAFNTAKIGGVDLYGLDMIVDAFRNSELARDYASLVCVSTIHPHSDHLERLRAKALDLKSHVHFVTDEISFAGVLRRCDVFVRPTITDGDAISVREALWYGKPVIASDAVVRPSGTILFRSRDVGQLVDRILSVAGANAPIGERRDFADDVIRIYEAVATRS